MASRRPPFFQENRMAKFRAQNFGRSDFKFNRWSLELLESETIESVMDSVSWKDILHILMGQDKTSPGGRGDFIEVRKMDTGLYAEFLVLEIGAGFVKLAPIRAFEPKVEEVADSAPLTTKWNVGKRAHDVIRKSDNTVMKSGFQSKGAAIDWINEHLKAMAA